MLCDVRRHVRVRFCRLQRFKCQSFVMIRFIGQYTYIIEIRLRVSRFWSCVIITIGSVCVCRYTISCIPSVSNITLLAFSMQYAFSSILLLQGIFSRRCSNLEVINEILVFYSSHFYWKWRKTLFVFFLYIIRGEKMQKQAVPLCPHQSVPLCPKGQISRHAKKKIRTKNKYQNFINHLKALIFSYNSYILSNPVG